MKFVYHVLIALALITAVGCGGTTGASPVAPSSTGTSSTPSLDLAGRWTGNFTMTGESGATRISSWTATQSGANVSGPLVVVADAGGDQEINVNTTLTGTISGTQITSATFTVPAGAIPGEMAACGFSGTGTLTATASSITGALAMTFPPACVGEELVSTTPTATWNITLTK